MAFRASDYPDIRKASEAYDVARAEFQRLDRQLNETSTSSSSYQDLVTRRNAAKAKSDTALKKYQDLVAKRKTEFETEQEKKTVSKKRKFLEAKIKTLEDDRQRAIDKGEDTTAIDNAIKKAQDQLTKAKVKPKVTEPPAVIKEPETETETKVETKTPTKTPAETKTETPTKTPTKKPAETPTPTPTAATDEEIFKAAAAKYAEVDEIFKSDPQLRELLRKAIGDPANINDDYKEERFLEELSATNWWKSNSGPIRTRIGYRNRYNTLLNAIKTEDPNYQTKIDELNRTSEYGRGLQNAIETVTEEWTNQYGTPTADDLVTIRAIATNLYDYANETDAVKIRNAVLTQPKKLIAGGIIGGKTGENLTDLRSIAAANGLDLDKDFKNSISTWLDRLSKGENIETIKSIIRNTAKTTWNVNDRIAGLLDQGVDLDTIYAPYKTRMAAILELSPGTITFSDLAAKGVVGGKEEKNLYDFEKELRRDPRWQYTANAREDVSNVALQVLRDFGFQG